KREADQIVIALRDRGFHVEYIVAPDEGHGFHRPVNNMAMFSQAEKFFAKYLNGRFQDSTTPEVAASLKEITVDVKSVTIPKKNAEAKPIIVDVGGIIFADGGGAFDVLARLPLTANYTTTFRNFDVEKQKVQLRTLKVAGAETVTVPAGTFDAYKVEIVAADN